MATGVAMITSVIQAPTGLRPSRIQVTQQSKSYPSFKSQLGRTFPIKKRSSITCIQANPKPDIEVVRPLANFPPSIWGDRFLSFSLDDSELEAYAKDMEEPKEDIRRLILSPTMDSNAKLRLINSVYRLGLKYLFEEEIDSQLDKLFKDFRLEDYDEADLYTVSINFQVFRQHGYRLSCDVFNKFKDFESGKFKECITNDVRGMLSFHESTQLRIEGESILDEGFAFTEAQLKGVVDTLQEDHDLARQVKHALRSPLHRGIPLVEARVYFSNYEKECSAYDSLLKLAFAHFNYLQLIHKNELQIVTKWSRDMELTSKYPFVRDRVPEIHLWLVAIYFEPHYSRARIIASKILRLVSLLNDVYDAYATIEELRLLTDVLNRWEIISAMEQLPGYAKHFFKVLWNLYAELDKELSKEGRQNLVNASKQAFQELARGYLQEAEWRYSGYRPSFQEYFKNGLISGAYDVTWRSVVLGMDCLSSEEVLAWSENDPKILEAANIIGRLQNDLVSFQYEGERGESVTGIDTYMKTFGVSESVAIDEVVKIIENAWKDINQGCLKQQPTDQVSMELLTTIANFAAMTDVAYRYGDGYTFPHLTFIDYITLLFVDPIPCTNNN